MQSEKNMSSIPTSVLFIPNLPPLLANWNTLKEHFSQYGIVRRVVLNPQDRSATVSFEKTADARAAKSEGCVYHNKEFQAMYCSETTPTVNSRTTRSSEILGYSELDTLWSDDDVEQFGVISVKPRQKESKIRHERQRTDELSSPKEGVKARLRDIKIPKLKSSVEKKSPKSPKLKSSSGNKSPISLKPTSERKARLMLLDSAKERQKEAKKKVKEALLELKKKRSSKLSEEGCVAMKASDTPTLSLKDRFNFLEERDKLIRKSLVKSSDVKTAKAIVGTCPDMCPEKERIMREYRRLVSIFEMIPGTQKMDHTIAVKAYVRSSADQEEPLPHELRPASVLSMTMSYLITRIMPLIDDPDVNVSEWYDFCWDRLRGIRKDVIQQRLCSLETVTIIEQCARFHICCYDYFWGADPSIFDEKINTENLMNCLQTLRHMYEDLSKEDIRCPNEAEFNAYMILLNMKTGDLMATYQLFSESLQKEERIQTAVKLYSTLNNGMYSQFFKLVKNSSTYLDSCLLQRYFYHVRVQALQAIARAYCPPNKGGTIPLKQMRILLKFDNTEDTESFCEGHRIMLKENGKDFGLYRNDFILPDTKIQSTRSSLIVTKKRSPLVEAVTGGRQYYLCSFEDHKIHSSFSESKLDEMSAVVSDQKSTSLKVIKTVNDEMIGDISDPDENMIEIKSEPHFTVSTTYSTGNSSRVTTETFGMIDDEIESEPYFTRIESFDMIDGDVGKRKSLPMDTDEVEDKAVVTSKNSFSETGFKKISDSDTDVSRQHSTAFKFELPSTKIESTKGNVQQSAPFSFSSAAANIFGSKSSQLQQDQFRLKLDVTGQSSRNDVPSIKEEKNVIKLRMNTDIFKPSVGNSEAVKQSHSYDINKSTDKVTAVDSNQFKFSLGGNNSISSSEIDKDVPVNVESSKIIKDASLNKSNINFSKSFTDFSTKVKEDKDFNKENDVQVIQPNKSAKKEISSPVGKNFAHEKLIASENQRKNEKEKRDLEAKRQIEIKRKLKERELFNQLKKDLRCRLKTVTARHFIRKWKQKVKRLKQNREEFPLLISTPVEKHESVWGTALGVKLLTTQTLVNRLKEKQHNIESTDLILNEGLHNTVNYIGKEIAENVVSNNSLRLELRDFNIPYYWKMVVSIPFSKGSFFAKKFYDWLNKLFYKSDVSQLGSVTKVETENFPVYYCVHLVTSQDFLEENDKLNGMNGLIFFNVSGIENSTEKCNRFRSIMSLNKSKKPVTVALLNIGKVTDSSNVQLVNIMDDKMKRQRIKCWIEETWSDFNSVNRIVKFLSLEVDLSNEIRVCTLYSLFSRINEHLVNVVDSAKIISDEFDSALMSPNFVIGFYNKFFSELEKLIITSNLRDYDIVPPEFKHFVCYLNRPGKNLPFDVTFNKTNRPNITKAFSKLKLPFMKPWPPQDPIELLNVLDAFCYSVGCNSILPRLVRAINLDDDTDVSKNLCKVSWVNIVDLVVRWVLETYSEGNNKIVIIYNENALSRLCKVEFGFKLLHSNLRDH